MTLKMSTNSKIKAYVHANAGQSKFSNNTTNNNKICLPDPSAILPPMPKTSGVSRTSNSFSNNNIEKNKISNHNNSEIVRNPGAAKQAAAVKKSNSFHLDRASVSSVSSILGDPNSKQPPLPPQEASLSALLPTPGSASSTNAQNSGSSKTAVIKRPFPPSQPPLPPTTNVGERLRTNLSTLDDARNPRQFGSPTAIPIVSQTHIHPDSRRKKS